MASSRPATKLGRPRIPARERAQRAAQNVSQRVAVLNTLRLPPEPQSSRTVLPSAPAPGVALPSRQSSVPMQNRRAQAQMAFSHVRSEPASRSPAAREHVDLTQVRARRLSPRSKMAVSWPQMAVQAPQVAVPSPPHATAPAQHLRRAAMPGMPLLISPAGVATETPVLPPAQPPPAQRSRQSTPVETRGVIPPCPASLPPGHQHCIDLSHLRSATPPAGHSASSRAADSLRCSRNSSRGADGLTASAPSLGSLSRHGRRNVLPTTPSALEQGCRQPASGSLQEKGAADAVRHQRLPTTQAKQQIEKAKIASTIDSIDERLLSQEDIFLCVATSNEVLPEEPNMASQSEPAPEPTPSVRRSYADPAASLAMVARNPNESTDGAHDPLALPRPLAGLSVIGRHVEAPVGQFSLVAIPETLATSDRAGEHISRRDLDTLVRQLLREHSLATPLLGGHSLGALELLALPEPPDSITGRFADASCGARLLTLPAPPDAAAQNCADEWSGQLALAALEPGELAPVAPGAGLNNSATAELPALPDIAESCVSGDDPQRVQLSDEALEVRAREHADFLRQHLTPLLEPAVHGLLRDRPEDPGHYMLQHLDPEATRTAQLPHAPRPDHIVFDSQSSRPRTAGSRSRTPSSKEMRAYAARARPLLEGLALAALSADACGLSDEAAAEFGAGRALPAAVSWLRETVRNLDTADRAKVTATSDAKNLMLPPPPLVFNG